MNHDYDDWTGDDIVLNQEMLEKSQVFLERFFEKIGISEKPIVSIVSFRKRGSFDFSVTDWNTEIFKTKVICQIDSEVYEDDKIIPLDEYLLPRDQDILRKTTAKNYVYDLTSISKEEYYLFTIFYHYKNVIGGSKETVEVYDDNVDKYIKIHPKYGFPDGIVTTISVKKNIKKEFKDNTFLIEIFKFLTRHVFVEQPKVETIDELLVEAGKNVLNNKIYKDFLINVDKNDGTNLFDLMHNVSLLKYESSENNGNILFCSQDIELENKIILTNPIPLSEFSYAAIRKLLEICSGDVCLLCDGNFIFGIGKRNVLQRLTKKAFIIDFKGQGKWDVVSYKNNKVMSVTHRVPSMPKSSVQETDFAIQFKKTFDSLEFQNVWRFINLAKEQSHGTMVVISKEAESESQRLCNQSFLINKTNEIQDRIINGITAIDGAILLDDKGICYSIGVILDGIANENIGTISRGARYNSALRYLNYCKEKNISCLIVIVSEDKYIDLKTVHDL
ncbi:hypothetical protein IHV12_21910 [Fictibacillus sp. 7GRE50]|uniref:hypothetical protein n=1 Tax=Fictibacillus sp. 7GRE50 TaxID=2745878 RepID=UPI0018CE5F3F|nr:hypothetical protein [Fictibacillus sp. 7GRE50]MBH0167567.1 hypothetical protein [Fictibacillus sp. 7GRE50]